ncbi:MAG TPA: lasso peptide biosynthesis PqqD family chaperone [Desulfobacteraceae bacterium]|nr:lasso peptide biosynthesis PqqD family chaperone [Desulfobacteraceae bacterium]|tara:strand:- start:1014 stop:1316 length:303 start_codon:yes stop_codon:yes gene_type:complete
MEKQKLVDLETTVVCSTEVVSTKVEGEVVMMSIEQGTYSGLDAIGSEIWRLLEKPISVSEICKAMTARYDVEKEQCEKDVLAFLNDLASDDTIQIVKSGN